jgi:enterochelin esterase family protein
MLQTGIFAQVSFPDSIFRQILSSEYNIIFDAQNQITNTDASDTITYLNLNFRNINDVTGIASFPNLKGLNVFFNNLTQLDLSGNPELYTLSCSNNALTDLDLAGKIKLRKLECSSNLLTGINITGDTALTSLTCNFNKITDLSLSDKFNLLNLECSNNLLASLDLKGCSKLYSLSLNGNKLSLLDISGSESIHYIYCNDNMLDSINITNCPNLESLYCSNNKLKTLDISNDTHLFNLICSQNTLAGLDLEAESSLYYLDCSDNKISELNVSANEELGVLICSSNSMKWLDISGCLKLGVLNCSVNLLASLDISNNKAINNMNISENISLTHCYVWKIPFPGTGILVFSTNTPVVYSIVNFRNGPIFSGFLKRVNSLPSGQKAAVVDSFLNAVGTFPLIEEDTIVAYVYKGTATSVTIAGDETNWQPNTLLMDHLPGTNLWYTTRHYESDTRLDYKYVINNLNWVFDTLNPNTVPSGFGSNSELRLPHCIPAPEIEYYPDIPHGNIITSTIRSSFLGNSRTIQVYLPPSYESSPGRSYPLVIFHDGLEYVSLALANNTLDNLIAEHKIDPIIGVFVPPVNRSDEYVANQKDKFVDFIAKELLVEIYANYRILPGAENLASVGISNGGDISLYLGLKLHDQIGNIGCFSPGGSFPHYVNGYQSSPKFNQKFYMDAGTYDIPGFLENTRFFVQNILIPKGYDYKFFVYHEGHSWGNWRAHLDDALMFFFPYTGGPFAVEENPSENMFVNELKNYPNPFSSSTELVFSLNQSSDVVIKLYSLTGAEIRTLANEKFPSGENRIRMDASGLKAGIYFASISVNMVKGNTVKLLLIK